MKNRLCMLLLFIIIPLTSGCFGSISDAIRKDDLKRVKAIISKDKSKINQSDIIGETSLHTATRKGNLEIINYLLSQGADINAKNNYRQTSLHLATHDDYFEIIKYLVEHGANVNAKDKDNDIPLHIAASKGSLEVVKYLISKGSEINTQGRFDETPLFNAVQIENLDIVKYLIEKGANIYTKNKSGNTPAHYAASLNREKILKYLISAGVDVNIKNRDGSTLLHFAAANGHLEIVKYLVSLGADINAKGNYTTNESFSKKKIECTPLHLAVYKNRFNVAEYLISQKADVNAKDEKGDSPLHYALYPAWMVFKKDHLGLTKLLVSNSADINSFNSEGNTPLHIAVKQGQTEIVKFLVSHNANIMLTNNEGKTAANLIGEYPNQELADYLNTQLQVAQKTQTYEQVKPLPEAKPPQSKVTYESAVAKEKRTPSSPNLDFGRYFALVIGNDNYISLPKLKTAGNDARVVSDTLKQYYGFNVSLLFDATRSDILLELNKLRKTLTKQDNLLLYYAGHGWLDKDADEGYWLPIDATQDNMINWVSNSSITATLRAIDAKHVLVVADSCYSGKLGRGVHIRNRNPSYFSRIAQKKARSVISSGGLEPVIDSGMKGNHSVFASAFIEALSENSAIMDGTQLFSKIRRPVMLNSDQTPEYSDIRKAGHDGGDFLFVRIK